MQTVVTKRKNKPIWLMVFCPRKRFPMVHTLEQRCHAPLDINGKIIDMFGRKKQIISN